ncbi:hypothetical protein FA13DRAFT_1166108 [Coprinellus micaceus]|uniref:Uncharacterized protein n=1 Tax=Coprinellus micaceus TaxID=71717 RepID=A0A4Y7SVW1_COPMI|nr:hypothetical protein FA13DRAFT_1166108 [Coprinellus micaceus]
MLPYPSTHAHVPSCPWTTTLPWNLTREPKRQMPGIGRCSIDNSASSIVWSSIPYPCTFRLILSLQTIA